MAYSYFKNNFTQSVCCTKEAFDSLLTDTTVIDNCAKIKHIVDNIPADASEADLKVYRDRIKQYKSGNKEKGIKQLPAWAFHAWFKNGYRKEDDAVPSGLVSIDLDHVDDPREFFLRLQPMALDEHLALAFITPSTKGLKLVFPLPEGAMSIEEAQDSLVTKLGVETYFDHGTMDLARLAFAVPQDYILYRNDNELFMERTVSADFGKIPTLTKEEQEDMIEHEARQKASEHFVDGISMDKMLTYLSMKYCNKPEPDVSRRNDTLYKTTKVMRVACQDDKELLYEVMPLWGQTQKEWNSTIKSATKRDIIAQASIREYDEMMQALKREKAIEEGLDKWELPEPPKVLPPVFREYARITPAELRPAQLMALLPILGFYGTMAKANFADPDEQEDMRTPGFIVVVSAPPASGKNHISHTYKELTEEQRQKELPILMQLNRYNQNKKEENPPTIPILLMPERLSMTSLSVQMENAKGRHLLQFTPEIDTLKSNNGSGAWNDLSTVWRKSTDNDNMGQIYMSGESHCCDVPVYLNQLIEAQPETLKALFNKRNVLNGLVSRVIIVELPDNTGCRKLKVKKMSDFEWSNVMSVVHKLQNIGTVVEPALLDEDGNEVKPAVMVRQELKLPRSRKALKLWGIHHQDHYLQSQENPAEDHFFRRAALLGFHAAMVAYMCNGCKESKEVIDFALWVAEYTLQSLLLHYGNDYNDIHTKRTDNRTENLAKLNETSKFDLFGSLADEFCIEDIRKACNEHGKSLKNPYLKIKCWKDANFIMEMHTDSQTKRWRKINQHKAADASAA